MTRDEQSAIKEMKYILKHYQKEELDISISTIRTALGYIDKLQKDNKHLKEQLLISNSLDNMYDLYVSKDKIRDKIKEVVEDELNQTNDLDRISRFYVRKILESLLEEE